MQMCRNAEVQRCIGAVMEVLRCRGAEEQIWRYFADVLKSEEDKMNRRGGAFLLEVQKWFSRGGGAEVVLPT